MACCGNVWPNGRANAGECSDIAAEAVVAEAEGMAALADG
jgi:hypothetical protein